TKAAQPTKAKPTPAPKKAQEIHFLCRADIKPAYAAKEAVDDWNATHDSKVVLDEPAEGSPVDVKVKAAQAAGDLVWDGFAVVEAPGTLVKWQMAGIVQPLDDYIAASTVPKADQVVPNIIPSIKESASIEGKVYGIPGNVGSVALAWFWEPLKAIGLEDQPETWDELYEAAKKIKEAKPDLVPFGSALGPLCDLYAILWSSRDDPFDENELVDIRSEEAIWALKWMRKMIEEGLMYDTPNTGLSQWLKGGWAMISSYDVAGTMAQQTFGMDAAATGINCRRFKGEIKAGTPFWINVCVVFDKCKNPQGMTDFYLWWFGPDNKKTGEQITKVAAKPCYKYTYDEFVKGHPEFEWEQKGIDLVAKSAWFRKVPTWGIQRDITRQYLDKVYDLSLKFEPQAWMDQAYKDIQAEIAKMK
ncbi:MAG: extracellular solute-binding protein, partial [Anaerolineae bacterium]|nr:extracellular solute-binding protein [Anaerolineae bacterium]